MRFYGLLDRDHAEVIELYASLDTAERELAEILRDEPSRAGRFGVLLVDFAGLSLRSCLADRGPTSASP